MVIRIFVFIAMIYLEWKITSKVDTYFYPNLPIELFIALLFFIAIIVTFIKVFPEKNKYKNY